MQDQINDYYIRFADKDLQFLKINQQNGEPSWTTEKKEATRMSSKEAMGFYELIHRNKIHSDKTVIGTLGLYSDRFESYILAAVCKVSPDLPAY